VPNTRSSDDERLERDFVDAILAETLVCHVAFVQDEQPRALPATHARVRDQLYLTGACSRLPTAVIGARICVVVSLVEGMVAARSAVDRSLELQSVILSGTAREVNDLDERGEALDMIIGRVASHRSPRGASESELRYRRVIKVPISNTATRVLRGSLGGDHGDPALSILERGLRWVGRFSKR
jgi:nitroimidazol reductase NimA-like FMN-containing flavoprotein (pyridoxamine 5'-phosphate oxidase superfamily)